jgi:hypothetical protein
MLHLAEDVEFLTMPGLFQRLSKDWFRRAMHRLAGGLPLDADRAGVQNWCGMLVVTASPSWTALKISQLTYGGMPRTYDSMH